jgi:putative oxidoreductase
MRILTLVARLLLGLMFTVFGLNFFFHFLPQPTPPPAAGAFAGAMFATGYIFHLLKVLEVASGLALLAGVFVPLALTVLAPIIVNIVFFHTFLAPTGLPIPLVILVLELFLAWAYRDAFAPLLNPWAKPKPEDSLPAGG